MTRRPVAPKGYAYDPGGKLVRTDVVKPHRPMTEFRYYLDGETEPLVVLRYPTEPQEGLPNLYESHLIANMTTQNMVEFGMICCTKAKPESVGASFNLPVSQGQRYEIEQERS